MGDDALVEMSARSTRCGASLTFEVVKLVTLPKDARRLIDLLAGTINDFVCPVCREPLRLRPMLAVGNPPAKELLVACASASKEQELREAAAREDWEIVTFPDYESLRQTVVQRAVGYLVAEIQPYLTLPAERPTSGQTSPHSAFVLLLLHAIREGRLPSLLRFNRDTSIEEQRAWWADLETVATTTSIDRLFTQAFHNGGPHTVLDRIIAEIPVECLTEETLRVLADRCVAWDADVFTDSSVLNRAWRFEYLSAAAHAAAGVVNPRGLQWADAHLTLFRLSRSSGFACEEFLLDTSVLSRTIRFQDAWRLTYAGRSADQPVPEEIPAWFDFIGLWYDYQAELWQVPFRVSFDRDADDEEIVATLTDTFLDYVARVGNGPKSIGLSSAMLCKIAFRSERPALGQRLAETILARLKSAEEWASAGWALKYLTEMFCLNLAYQVADQLQADHAAVLLDDQHELPCDLRYRLLNEIGNVHRYQSRPWLALETYAETAAVMDDCPDVTEQHRRALLRNNALALRDSGQIEVAVETLRSILEQLPAEAAEAVGVRQNIGRTLCEAGLAKEALIELRAAQRVPLSAAHAQLRIWLLVTIAVARIAAESEPETPELDEALAAAGSDVNLRRFVANAVLHCAQRATVAAETTAEAEQIVQEYLASSRDGVDSMYVSLLTSLAGWRYEQGLTEEADRLLDNIRDSGLEDHEMPWQTLWLMARAADPAALADRAWYLWLALKRLELKVPGDVGPSYAASWLQDKGPFQQFLANTIQQAIAAEIVPAHAGIDVCEFVNGREVRPRELHTVDDPWQTFSAVVPADNPAVAVAFLQGDSAIDMIVVPSWGAEPAIVRLSTPVDRVLAAQAVFDRNIGSRALLPSQHQKAADALAEILADVGATLKRCVEPGVHICLLPSAAVLGLPLHAASADGRLLLEDHAISYGPNLAMVCDLLADGSVGSPAIAHAGVIVVPKEGDKREYVGRGDQAAVRLSEALAVSGNSVVLLRDTEGSKAACLDAFENLEYLALLVHGAQSRGLHGRALCVSDGTELPHAPLLAESDSQLRRFLIDAGDLTGLVTTPATVVSLACSSGQTTVGAGGSRIGLDRALLPNGTRTIVAPLWDVNQESALSTLEDFQRGWIAEPELGPAEHLRRAQIKARERNNSLYHWAPLVLKGNWL